jgi:hypothetical protein
LWVVGFRLWVVMNPINPQPTSLYQWHLTDVERVKKLRKPKGQPQPVWFTPFQANGQSLARI